MANASIKNNPKSEYFAYFGFGSLVNRNTLPHDHVAAIPATLKGWRRHWQARPRSSVISANFNSLALLSIHRDRECRIDGLLVIDRAENLPALEKREHAYQKISLDAVEMDLDKTVLKEYGEVLVHTHVSALIADTGKSLSILRSYLDVVMQGYYREYGEAGLEQLMQSTKGFHLPVTEDRAKPVYSRHQPISVQETAIFDKYLPNQCWHN